VISRSAEQPPKRRRWGLWTLGFLILAIVALITAQMQGYNSIGTVGCFLIGFAGAAYCSIRGWKSLLSLDWTKRR
jgi:hypothetical protein